MDKLKKIAKNRLVREKDFSEISKASKLKSKALYNLFTATEAKFKMEELNYV
jgi:hypothetical protein